MNNNRSLAAAQQPFHNTTSWAGHRLVDHLDVTTGQTFISNAEGDLDNIEIFSSAVTAPGLLNMTVHQYDPEKEVWGPSLASATVPVNSSHQDQWLSFKMPGLHLNKGATYGFQVQSNDTFVGLGEAAGSADQPPYNNGKEWRFNKNDSKTQQYSYFSLAFKVGLCA